MLPPPDVLSSISSRKTDRLTSGREAFTEKLVKNSPQPIMAAEVSSPYVKRPPLESTRILRKLDVFRIGLFNPMQSKLTQ
jgi:hypothetical protein